MTVRFDNICLYSINQSFEIHSDDLCIPCQTQSSLDLDIYKTSATELFYKNLKFFLYSVPQPKCTIGGHAKHYINSNIRDIRSSFMIKANHIPLRTTEDHIFALQSARFISDQMTMLMQSHVAQRGSISPEQVAAIKVFPYSPFYLFYDYMNFSWTTMITIFGTFCLVFVCYLLTSGLSVYSSLFVVVVAFFISAQMIGVMYFWHVAGTKFSLSFVQICVGVSVRFSTLLVSAFGNSTRKQRRDRQKQAILSTTSQVLFGVIGTKVFGLIPLAFAGDPVCFRLLAGLCVSGWVHAAFVVPTMIGILGENMSCFFFGFFIYMLCAIGPSVNRAKVRIKVAKHQRRSTIVAS